MLLPAQTQVYINLRFYVIFSSVGFDDIGTNKHPDYDDDDDDSSVPVGAKPIVSEFNQKWYRKGATESEESERKIPVGKTLDGRHVLAGKGDNVYTFPVKKKN